MSGTSRFYTTKSLKGQVVLITGASSGIGEACAYRFAEQGCKLVLIARRMNKLEEVKQRCKDEFGTPDADIHLARFDVKDLDKVSCLPRSCHPSVARSIASSRTVRPLTRNRPHRLRRPHLRSHPQMDELKASFPPGFADVDILVNNAGLALGRKAAQDNVIADVATMLNTNVAAVMAFASTFVPGMVERNAGHVVNLSSIAAHEAYPGGSVYCATKHAVDAFTVSMRHDLVGTQVRVTAISPGAVRTEFTLVRLGGDASKEDDFYKGFAPLTAADIADQVLYVTTRPDHVQVGDLISYATNQASARDIHKQP